MSISSDTILKFEHEFILFSAFLVHQLCIMLFYRLEKNMADTLKNIIVKSLGKDTISCLHKQNSTQKYVFHMLLTEFSKEYREIFTLNCCSMRSGSVSGATLPTKMRALWPSFSFILNRNKENAQRNDDFHEFTNFFFLLASKQFR